MTIRRTLGYGACFVLGLLAGGVLIGQWMKTDPVPVPAGASSEIQEAISSAKPVSVALWKQLRPQSEKHWRNAIEKRAEAQAVSLEALSAELDVEIVRDTIAGVPVHWVTPDTLSDGASLFVYLHGGAYVFGGGDTSVREAALIARKTGMKALSIDYRMPPDHPHPAAIEDVAAVYRVVLESWPASRIGMGGTSAGGGLTLASVHHFKDQGIAVPGALYLGTPWADISKTSDSTLYDGRHRPDPGDLRRRVGGGRNALRRGYLAERSPGLAGLWRLQRLPSDLPGHGHPRHVVKRQRPGSPQTQTSGRRG